MLKYHQFIIKIFVAPQLGRGPISGRDTVTDVSQWVTHDWRHDCGTSKCRIYVLSVMYKLINVCIIYCREYINSKQTLYIILQMQSIYYLVVPNTINEY